MIDWIRHMHTGRTAVTFSRRNSAVWAIGNVVAHPAHILLGGCQTRFVWHGNGNAGM